MSTWGDSRSTDERTEPADFVGAVLRTDLVMVGTAVAIALAAGWGKGGPLWIDTSRQALAVAVLIVWPAMLWQRQSRISNILGGGDEEYRRVIVASGWMVLVVATFAYFSDTTRARSFLAGVAILGTALLLGGRWVMRTLLQRRLDAGHPLHRVFLVAPTGQLESVRSDLRKSRNRYVEVGFITDDGDQPAPEDVVSCAQFASADTILYVPFPNGNPHWTRRLGWALEDTDLALMVSHTVVEVAGPRLAVSQIEGTSFLSVGKPPLNGPARVVKRAVDLIGSLAGLLVLAVPMGVIALLIRLDSPGPILFRQERMGQGGSTFTCLKFRTMRTGAEEELETLRNRGSGDGATFKLERDPRVTRVGAVLRRSSLDELPQLWNVLRNEMSLVGPRPHQLSDAMRYEGDDRRRLLTKPGITGLWQVSGRSDTSWDENVMMDLYYVENWSLSLDAVIMLRTVSAVITGSGAY